MERTYKSQEDCPVARTLDILGDRWTLLVVRDLFLGQSKFSEILESLEGISPNLLADRLKRLEQQGIVGRVFYSDHPPRAEYRLTEKGQELVSVIWAMAEWGLKHELDDEQRARPRLRENMAKLGIKPERPMHRSGVRPSYPPNPLPAPHRA